MFTGIVETVGNLINCVPQGGDLFISVKFENSINDIEVGEFLTQNGGSVTRYVRFEVGEGIEKKTDNFAEEVMAQVRESQ